MGSPFCLCVWIFSYQLLNAWNNFYETWYVYLCTWVHINGALHKSFPSVRVSVSVSVLSLLGKGSVKCILPVIVSQRFRKQIPVARNTRSYRIIVGRVIFCEVHVLLKESLWVCTYIPILLLRNSSVNISTSTKIYWRHRFNAIYALWMENRLLVLPKISYSNYESKGPETYTGRTNRHMSRTHR
jgi:hypothetical protein